MMSQAEKKKKGSSKVQ